MTDSNKNHSRPIIIQLFCFNHDISKFIKPLLFLQLLQYATAQTRTVPPAPDQFTFSPNFSSSMAVILVVIMSALFCLAFLSVFVRQCAERHFRGAGNGNPSLIGGIGLRSRSARGLDPEVIETFPTFTYSSVKGLRISKDSLECAVCLNEFEDDETLRLLPRCNHVFHPDCIDAWLSSHTTCPVCRANLVPKPGEIPSAIIQIFDSDFEPVEPNHITGPNEARNEVLISGVNDVTRPVMDVESPDVNLLSPGRATNRNRPPRSWSTGFRITGIFPRSHSTGQSLVQPGQNHDRFTLRLPEEVRSQLLNWRLNRTKSCVAFPRVRSSRRGFRSGSVGSGQIEGGGGKSYFYARFDQDNRSGRRGFSMTPPFFSRTGSSRSAGKVGSDGEDVTAIPKNLSRPVKSPLDRLFQEMGKDKDNNGSNNADNDTVERLRSNSEV